MAFFHRNRNYSSKSSCYNERTLNSQITSNATSKDYNRHHYISPLEKLDQLSERYTPQKVYENNQLKKLYQNGVCKKFEPSEFKHFYINNETSMNILDDLIEYIYYVKHFTINIKGQIGHSRQPSTPALLSIEFIREGDPSIIILIETMYLPPANSPKFNKIKKLCKIIFSPNNTVNGWENPKIQLKKFTRFNLFDDNDIDQIKPEHIQSNFKSWFSLAYPRSIDRKTNFNGQYSLQSAIYLVCNQWLDKRMTLANWGHGIDLALKTYTPTDNYDEEQARIIHDEEEYRQLMTISAINDCSAVTKLAYKVTSIKHS